MSQYGPFHVEAKTIGGRQTVADLQGVFTSWSATDLLNAPGVFSGTLAEADRCAEALSRVEPWWTEIEVTNQATGAVLWSGPTVVAPESQSVESTDGTITGNTMLWWPGQRAVRDDIDHTGDPVSAVAYAVEVLTSALTPHDPNLLDYLTAFPGSDNLERAVKAYRGNAAETLSDLLGTSIDMWCRGRAINVGPVGYCYGNLGRFGASIIGGAYSTVRRGDVGATRGIVLSTDGTVLADEGGAVLGSDGVTSVLIEDISYANGPDLDAAASIAAGRVTGGRAPLQFVADSETGWLDCSADISAERLAVGVCLQLEIPTWNGRNTVVIDARIVALRWSFDGAEYKVGIQVADRSGVVL